MEDIKMYDIDQFQHIHVFDFSLLICRQCFVFSLLFTGKALADEFHGSFLEVSAKDNSKVIGFTVMFVILSGMTSLSECNAVYKFIHVPVLLCYGRCS